MWGVFAVSIFAFTVLFTGTDVKENVILGLLGHLVVLFRRGDTEGSGDQVEMELLDESLHRRSSSR